MSTKDILQKINRKKSRGLLDYKWAIRSYLSKMGKKSKKLNADLISDVISPFIYISTHKDNVHKDKSLKAVCQLCTDIDHVIDVHHKDQCLIYFANLFNELTNSGRSVYMCYDCGTVARGLFFQLINAYRGNFTIKPEEIAQIKKEYYMDKYNKTDGISVLMDRVHSIRKNCLFLCAMQLGEKFGHIYILEKIYIDGKPRFRLYQSCLNAYLLIDYIEMMDYGNNISAGIDVDQHLKDLYRLLSTPSWDNDLINMFIYWYKFYPHSGPKESEKKLFTSTFVIF